MKKAVLYFTTTGPGAGTTTWTKVTSESPAAGTMVPYKSTVVLNVSG
jgi:beta-lactam-binding protein with PASTA domain